MSDPRRDRQPEPRRPGGPQQAPPERTLAELWPGYLEKGYFDERGALWPELIERARIEPLAKAMADARPGLNPHQARRFFQHCRGIEARLRARAGDEQKRWTTEREQVLKLDYFAADAAGKRDPKIPQIFHEFIRTNILHIKTQMDFEKGFLSHFEALLGFGARHLSRNRERT